MQVYFSFYFLFNRRHEAVYGTYCHFVNLSIVYCSITRQEVCVRVWERACVLSNFDFTDLMTSRLVCQLHFSLNFIISSQSQNTIQKIPSWATAGFSTMAHCARFTAYFVFPGKHNHNFRRVIANVINGATLRARREDRRRHESAAIGFRWNAGVWGSYCSQS